MNGAQGGNIWFYSAGGIVAGASATFDVGSLVLTANDPGTTLDLSGGNSFTAATGSTAAVEIRNGASINANGSYVALVAPRVVQAGNVKVNGAAAYVAAEQATLTFTAGGLFDIAVAIGSDAADPDGHTLVHSGRTEAIAAANAASPRAYLVAVPKNDAITMLVGGTLGFAAGAHNENGVIVLDAGYDMVDQAAGAAHGVAGIAVSGAAFGSRVVARSTGDFGVSSTGATDTVSFAQNLNVAAAGGIDLLASGAGAQITGAGGQTLRATGADGSHIGIDAAGGTIALAGMLVADTSAAAVAGQPVTGGRIDITAHDGGRFSSARSSWTATPPAASPRRPAPSPYPPTAAARNPPSARSTSSPAARAGAGGGGLAGGDGTARRQRHDRGQMATASPSPRQSLSMRAVRARHRQRHRDGGRRHGRRRFRLHLEQRPLSVGNTVIDAHGAGGNGGLDAGGNALAGSGGNGDGGIVSISTGGTTRFGELSIDARGLWRQRRRDPVLRRGWRQGRRRLRRRGDGQRRDLRRGGARRVRLRRRGRGGRGWPGRSGR